MVKRKRNEIKMAPKITRKFVSLPMFFVFVLSALFCQSIAGTGETKSGDKLDELDTDDSYYDDVPSEALSPETRAPGDRRRLKGN